MIKLKRVYEKPSQEDGKRFLVDRLWPRGLRKEEAKLDAWLKELAPSDRLRTSFKHRKERWEEFRKKYREELAAVADQKLLDQIRNKARRETITLLFAARDTEHNNAVVLKEFLEKG